MINLEPKVKHKLINNKIQTRDVKAGEVVIIYKKATKGGAWSSFYIVKSGELEVLQLNSVYLLVYFNMNMFPI